MFTSYEMAEWQGYEMAHGPIDGSWDRETLAQIHELLQTISYIGGAQAEENPIPQPTVKDRPGSAYGFGKDEYGMYTVVPEEVKEEVELAPDTYDVAEVGFDALDEWIAEENREG